MSNDYMQLRLLDGKRVLVTGAAGGLGSVICEYLAKFGAIVFLTDSDRSKLQKTYESLKKKEHDCYMKCADLTNDEQIGELIESLYIHTSQLDGIVNCAGVTFPQNTEVYSDNMWEKTLKINLTAPYKICKNIVPLMKDHGGSIINITSLNSEVGGSNNPAYISSKGGLKLLTKALAKDWAKYNIRINNLGLGYFKTDMTKRSYKDTVLRKIRTERIMLNRWGGTEDIVGPSIFLASPAAQYITGQDIYVDGGVLSNGI